MSSKEARLIALVKLSQNEPRVKHHLGLPPELTAGQDLRQLLPRATVLVIETSPDGGYYLFRFTEDGTGVGYTWHETIERAKDHAEFEFEWILSGWKKVPRH